MSFDNFYINICIDDLAHLIIEFFEDLYYLKIL